MIGIYFIVLLLLFVQLVSNIICVLVTQTEELLATGESLAGPYVWGRYDLLVLPPSFPYGGMENPCLTFVTPTLLVSQ